MSLAEVEGGKDEDMMEVDEKLKTTGVLHDGGLGRPDGGFEECKGYS